MRELKEWERHIYTGRYNSRKTYCGEDHPNEWCFVDPTHALLYITQGGSVLVPCPDCLREIKQIVENGLAVSEGL